MPTKILKDFCPGSLLESSYSALSKAEILQIFGWHFGRNDDLINSFWIQLAFRKGGGGIEWIKSIWKIINIFLLTCKEHIDKQVKGLVRAW